MSGEDRDTIGSRHRSLNEQVLTELRERIIEGAYPPGERLTEERLAADFGVSRNPVREALRVASAEGFVRLVTRQGAFVTSPGASEVGDLFAIRARLEPLAARLAAARAGREEAAELRRRVAEAQEAYAQQELGRLSKMNSSFHLRVAEMSGNRWLTGMTSSVYWHVQRIYRRGAAARGPHSWIEHGEIAGAIEAGDMDRAEAAALAHVQVAAGAAVAHLGAQERAAIYRLHSLAFPEDSPRPEAGRKKSRG